MFKFDFALKKILFCFLTIFECFNSPMEDRTDSISSSFIKNVATGSAAGTAEVLVNQPTVFIKNALQQQRNVLEVIRKSPRDLYRGLGVNAVCMIPTTAAQVAISDGLKQFVPGDATEVSFMRNAVAGGFSALLCNPSELVIINQQNWKTNAWVTAQRLYHTNGIKVGLRGYVAKASRDATFCAGFLTAYPLLKEFFKKKLSGDAQATVFAVALVGPTTAAFSHPLDTISTKMQADPTKESVRGFIDATQKIYSQGGTKAFFAGFIPRTTRIMIAIPLMNGVKDWLNSDNGKPVK